MSRELSLEVSEATSTLRIPSWSLLVFLLLANLGHGIFGVVVVGILAAHSHLHCTFGLETTGFALLLNATLLALDAALRWRRGETTWQTGTPWSPASGAPDIKLRSAPVAPAPAPAPAARPIPAAVPEEDAEEAQEDVHPPERRAVSRSRSRSRA